MRDEYAKKENKVLVIVSVIFAAAIITIAAVFLMHNVFRFASKIGNKDDVVVEENEVVEEVTSNLRIGDKVSYTPPIGKYLWLAKYSDNQEDVEITNESADFQVTNWKVLNINDDDTVDLVSAKQTKGVVYLGNYNGYNNGVKLLNDLCYNLYSDETKGIVGRSIAIEDIENHLNENAKMVANKYSNGYVEYGQEEPNPNTDSTLYPNIYPNERLSKVDGKIIYNGLKVSQQEEFYEGATEGKSIQPTQTYWGQNYNYIQRAFEGENTGSLNRAFNVIIPDGENT